ncbi:MAG: type III-B CRISPR module-associated Cmr3 family protein, partial [Nitrospinota bacterium]
GALKVIGPFPGKNRKNPFFPTPLTLFNYGRNLFPCPKGIKPNFAFNGNKPDNEDPWISKDSLAAYLKEGPGFDPAFCYTIYEDESKCFVYERQHGHQRDKSRRPEDTKLFGIYNQRCKPDAGYFFLVSGITLSENRLFYFGGDRGRGTITKVEENFSFSLDSRSSDGFCVYLLTPCPVNDFPSENSIFTDKGDYLFHATGKPLYVGGFDIKKGKPKALHRMYPQGTVVFFKNRSGSSIDHIKMESISSIHKEWGTVQF